MFVVPELNRRAVPELAEGWSRRKSGLFFGVSGEFRGGRALRLGSGTMIPTNVGIIIETPPLGRPLLYPAKEHYPLIFEAADGETEIFTIVESMNT